MTIPLPDGVSYAAPRLKLTPKAVEMAKAKLLDAGEPVYGLRLGVKGGGCAGYSYVIEYATKFRSGKDLVYDFDGLHVVVDQKSIEVLDGSTLDWERRLMGYGFKWVNPNAKSDCGCGESFDVT